MSNDILEILEFTQTELARFLRFRAGLSNPNFGGGQKGTVGGVYNLRLQQHPEEYARLLVFLREQNAKSYLELGVGQGGSFLLNSLMQENLEVCHAVDDCDYQRNAPGFWDQNISIEKSVIDLKEIKRKDNIKFFNKKSNDFFVKNDLTYDIIFIDADHRYEGVKKDYAEAVQVLNPHGFLIFHDIINYDPGIGVPQFWSELDKDKKIREFKDSGFAGIGIYKP